MPKMVGIKEAVESTGLSEWELKRGIRNGEYPYIRIGEGRGKFLFDLDLLHDTLKKRALSNVHMDNTAENVVQFGIRAIAE